MIYTILASEVYAKSLRRIFCLRLLAPRAKTFQVDIKILFTTKYLEAATPRPERPLAMTEAANADPGLAIELEAHFNRSNESFYKFAASLLDRIVKDQEVTSFRLVQIVDFAKQKGLAKNDLFKCASDPGAVRRAHDHALETLKTTRARQKVWDHFQSISGHSISEVLSLDSSISIGKIQALTEYFHASQEIGCTFGEISHSIREIVSSFSHHWKNEIMQRTADIYVATQNAPKQLGKGLRSPKLNPLNGNFSQPSKRRKLEQSNLRDISSTIRTPLLSSTSTLSTLDLEDDRANCSSNKSLSTIANLAPNTPVTEVEQGCVTNLSTTRRITRVAGDVYIDSTSDRNSKKTWRTELQATRLPVTSRPLLGRRQPPNLTDCPQAIASKTASRLENLLHKTKVKLDQAIAALADEERSNPNQNTKLRYSELPQYLELLQNTGLGQPVGFERYKSFPDRHCYGIPMYLVCTEQEARQVLSAPEMLLPVPILVKDASHGLEFSIKEMASRLKQTQCNDIDVQSGDGAPGQISTRLRDTRTVLDQLLTERYPQYPLNLLNLQTQIDSPVPSCIANLDNFRLLKIKSAVAKSADLTSCLSWHIMAQKGAWSFPHMDHHGVWTTIRVNEGEKLWPMYPRLRRQEILSWATSGEIAPSMSSLAFAIYVEKNDILIQPPGRVHFPFSITNVLITGTMHWNSRELIDILRQSLLELAYDHITNEDHTEEFQTKLHLIKDAWAAADDPQFPYEGAPYSEYVEFERLLSVSSDSVRPGILGTDQS